MTVEAGPMPRAAPFTDLVMRADGDPAALPAWLASTTGRECGRIALAARTSPSRPGARRRQHP